MIFAITGIKRTALLLVALGAASLVSGCNSSTQPPTSGQIVMASEYSREISGTLQAVTQDAPSGVDSVAVTRIRIVLRDIKFKTQSDSAAFRTSPFVLELNLNGTLQNVSVADVPFGTYRRIEFDVHKVIAAEIAVLSPGEQAKFQDFLVDGGKSIVVDGRVYRADGAHSFTFYSASNVNQKIELARALEVSEDYPVANVTMKVTAGDWFSDSKGGLLDPLDSSDQNAISHNISGSIHVFKDTNRDGESD